LLIVNNHHVVVRSDNEKIVVDLDIVPVEQPEAVF